MKVLIVAKTKYGPNTCVGGLDSNDTSVRLLEANGSYPDPSIYDVGEIWDIRYTHAVGTKPPHSNEDVLVSHRVPHGIQANLASHIKGRLNPWVGGISSLYDGKLGFTGNRRGYIGESDIPDRSTWFWIPDEDLKLVLLNGKPYYSYGFYKMSYAGVAPPVATIASGTLVRVSLARWWKPSDAAPDFEERCYLQLSGWYK